MRIHEAAALVEREGLPAVARTRKQRMKLVFIVFAYVRNHSSPIPFPLKERMNCQVFQFQYAVPLISNHSYGYGCSKYLSIMDSCSSPSSKRGR